MNNNLYIRLLLCLLTALVCNMKEQTLKCEFDNTGGKKCISALGFKKTFKATLIGHSRGGTTITDQNKVLCGLEALNNLLDGHSLE